MSAGEIVTHAEGKQEGKNAFRNKVYWPRGEALSAYETAAPIFVCVGGRIVKVKRRG